MAESHQNDIKGLVQERRNSSALAMELRLSCTNPLILSLLRHLKPFLLPWKHLQNMADCYTINLLPDCCMHQCIWLYFVSREHMSPSIKLSRWMQWLEVTKSHGIAFVFLYTKTHEIWSSLWVCFSFCFVMLTVIMDSYNSCIERIM